jgi:hypothetical protein
VRIVSHDNTTGISFVTLDVSVFNPCSSAVSENYTTGSIGHIAETSPVISLYFFCDIFIEKID